MNKNKFLITVTSKEMYETIKKVGYTNFLFPLKDFTVGISRSFSFEEIPASSYIYMNRILDTRAMENLKILLPKYKEKIKGIVFEDIGILELLKEENLSFERILYQTHINASLQAVEEMNALVDSVVLCTDITLEEIKEIIKQSSKPVTLFTFGVPTVMISRRNLIQNFTNAFHTEYKPEIYLEEEISAMKFHMVENAYGVATYPRTYFSGKELLSLCPVHYFFIHPLFLSTTEILEVLKSLEKKENPLNVQTNSGFLYQKTIVNRKDEYKEGNKYGIN